jgi:hypothetical protein
MKPWEAPAPATSSAFDAIDSGHGPVVGRRVVQAGRVQYAFWGHTLGIEQWENGKRSEGIRDQWTWECQQTALQAAQPPDCALTITRILLFGTAAVGTLVSTDVYTTMGRRPGDTRQIIFRQVDWSKGILDFSLSTPSKPPIEVQLRLALDSDLLTLQSFRGLVVSTPLFTDSPIQPIEFRLPPYSYTLYAPFPMPGQRPSQQRGWGDLIASLSPADQRAWSDHRQRRAELAKLLEAELKRSADAPSTAEDRRRTAALDGAFLNGLRQWLATSTISPEGRQRMLDHLRAASTGVPTSPSPTQP